MSLAQITAWGDLSGGDDLLCCLTCRLCPEISVVKKVIREGQAVSLKDILENCDTLLGVGIPLKSGDHDSIFHAVVLDDVADHLLKAFGVVKSYVDAALTLSVDDDNGSTGLICTVDELLSDLFAFDLFVHNDNGVSDRKIYQ